ncbi:MAG: hypothetical protein QJR13_05350 [Bacillota bacterium]|nr:hypothetical protein [Bacillota bacterium]
MTQLLIPAADPVGLPAPPWLLQFLLVLTFVLHILPMSLVLGGGFIAVWTHLTGDNPAARRLVAHLAGILPSAIAYTITLGIAPLLFVQLLYGTLFYTSSILMGFPWLAALGLLLIGYYSLYLYAEGGRRAEGERPAWAGVLSVACFIGVSYLITNNLSLMVSPAGWAEMYAADPSGTSLRLPVQAVLPRYLHAFSVALTLAASYVVLHGFWSARSGGAENAEYGQFVRRWGAGWLSGALALQAVMGAWYLSSLSGQAKGWLLGGDPAMALFLALGTLLMAAGGILLLLAAGRNATGSAWAGGAGVLLGTVCLAIVRHLLENRTAAQFLPAGAWDIRPQWAIFVLFALILVLGLGLVAWMVLRVQADLKGGAAPRAGLGTGAPGVAAGKGRS